MKEFDSLKFNRGQIFWRRDTPHTDDPGIIAKDRPVLIVSNNMCNQHSPVVSIVPITTNGNSSNLPTHVSLVWEGQSSLSWVLCENAYAINKKHLDTYIATVSEKKMKEIDRALAIQFGLVDVVKPNPIIIELPKEDCAIKEASPKNLTRKAKLNRFSTAEKLQYLIDLEEVQKPDDGTDKMDKYTFCKKWNQSSWDSAVAQGKSDTGRR